MKISFNLFCAAVLMAGLGILSACGSSGGGSDAGAVAGYGAVGASGTTGFAGVGTWSGALTINNQPLYVRFLVENNLCFGQSCSAAAGYMNLQMSTASACGGGAQQPGFLPGPVQFVIRNYINGNQGQMLNACGSGFINASNNGILVNYTNPNTQYAGGGFGYGQGYQNGYYQNPGQAYQNPQNGASQLQINTQWVDGAHQTMNVQVLYAGNQVASGQVIGNVNMQGYGGVGYAQPGYYGNGQTTGVPGYGVGYSFYNQGGYSPYRAGWR